MLLKRNEKWYKHNHVFTGYGGLPYFKVGDGAIDGVNRQHCPVYADCQICGKKILIGYVHTTKEGLIYKNS